jgi:hypothetical protein
MQITCNLLVRKSIPLSFAISKQRLVLKGKELVANYLQLYFASLRMIAHPVKRESLAFQNLQPIARKLG